MKTRLLFILFLVCTLLTGLTLRWQLAGVSFDWALGLDWRRAHSHLGFYGALFPMAWMTLQSLGLWTPSWKLWLSYSVLVAVAAIAFLIHGYNLVSIAASTGILAVWLLFAWKNRRAFWKSERDWLAATAPCVFLAALLIPVVAVLTHRDPELASEVARTFLTLLLLGVFVPSSLRSLQLRAPRPLVWLICTVGSALFLPGLVSHPLLGLGLVGLGAQILFSFFHKAREEKIFRKMDWDLLVAWVAFALSFVLTGTRLLPYTYYQAIAGIHFLVLGPLLMTFAFHHLKIETSKTLKIGYELSLLAMVTSISLQSWVSLPLFRVAAIAGTFLILFLLGIAVEVSLKSTRTRNSQAKA